jgi:hypothetical protein
MEILTTQMYQYVRRCSVRLSLVYQTTVSFRRLEGEAEERHEWPESCMGGDSFMF